MPSELWYALRVKSRCESLVVANLALKGYAPFLPTYKTKRRWSDRVKVLELPLFPGYIFCPLDVRFRLPVLTTPGVHAIVGIGRSPEPIPNEEIETIRSVVTAGVNYNPHRFVSVGQLVRIERGSLTGVVGIVTESRSEFRIIVSVNLLMRSVAVEIDRSWVEPIRPLPQEKSLIQHDPAKLRALSRGA